MELSLFSPNAQCCSARGAGLPVAHGSDLAVPLVVLGVRVHLSWQQILSVSYSTVHCEQWVHGDRGGALRAARRAPSQAQAQRCVQNACAYIYDITERRDESREHHRERSRRRRSSRRSRHVFSSPPRPHPRSSSSSERSFDSLSYSSSSSRSPSPQRKRHKSHHGKSHGLPDRTLPIQLGPFSFLMR